MSEILKFYKNQNVLITGATGFLGKVLLWKLLDSCKEIGTIYVLMRSKNNVPASKRLIQLLKDKPFNYKYDYAELSNKVVAIESDMTEEGLGLSSTDRTLLEEKVNIVLHCAASVKFDAPIKDNMRDNVYGTRSILKLCESSQNLVALVHVSTAYSNCNLSNIDEELIPLERDAEEIVKMVESLPNDAGWNKVQKLIEGRPNTYTFTKAVAEQFVSKYEGKFPISIVRPSIVISSEQEPAPGWIDNINGIGGLGCLGAIGILRSIDWDYFATADMVPVDYVANNIICAAYHSAKDSPKKLKIFNMTSGNLAPITWGGFFEKLRAKQVKEPPTKILRPTITIPKYKRANRVSIYLTKIFSELFFAYLVDFILAVIGYKKIMVKITRKMHNGHEVLRPFITREWNFSSNNVVDLSESLPDTDRTTFNFDMRNFDWDTQSVAVWRGARKLLLKEEDSKASIDKGLKRQKLVTIIHYAMTFIFIAMIAVLGHYSSRLIGVY